MISGQDRELIESFKAYGESVAFKSRDIVFFQGEQTRLIGLIIQGSIRATAYSAEGSETWLGQFTEGDLIGHSSVLSGSDLRYEAIAETDLSIIFIKPGVLNRLINEEVGLGEKIATDLAQKVDTMTMRLIEAYTLSAKGRICAELMRMSSPVGIEPDKTLIRPSPVFVDLAIRVNSTRETVSRTVSGLQKKGVLSREPGAILIHKPAALNLAIR